MLLTATPYLASPIQYQYYFSLLKKCQHTVGLLGLFNPVVAPSILFPPFPSLSLSQLLIYQKHIFLFTPTSLSLSPPLNFSPTQFKTHSLIWSSLQLSLFATLPLLLQNSLCFSDVNSQKSQSFWLQVSGTSKKFKTTSPKFPSNFSFSAIIIILDLEKLPHLNGKPVLSEWWHVPSSHSLWNIFNAHLASTLIISPGNSTNGSELFPWSTNPGLLLQQPSNNGSWP